MKLDTFPFPSITQIGSPPKDGLIFKCPIFCLKNFNTKCVNYYTKIQNSIGFHQCPYGFASNVVNNNAKNFIITSLFITSISHRKNIRKRIHKNDFLPKLNLSNYSYIIDNYLLSLSKHDKGNNFSISSELINDVFHELRKLNSELKKQSDYLLRAITSDNIILEQAQNRAHNIFSTAQLISIRLNAFDFNLNPELPFNSNTRQITVYKKFEKAVHCLDLKAKNKKLRIITTGNSHFKIKAYDIFELLPYLLIENAIKYSPSNYEITIDFKESRNNLTIEIINFGPAINVNEIPKLFDREFRGENAKASSPEGLGLGLYLAKKIADAHKFEIFVFPNKTHFEEDGHKLAEFAVRLNFQ